MTEKKFYDPNNLQHVKLEQAFGRLQLVLVNSKNIANNQQETRDVLSKFHEVDNGRQLLHEASEHFMNANNIYNIHTGKYESRMDVLSRNRKRKMQDLAYPDAAS